MATLSSLVTAGALERISVELEGRLSWRSLYGTPEFIRWLDEVLPYLEPGSAGAEITPNEQVDALFFDFISGERLEEDRRFKALSRTPDLFVWELKTIDVRIFGWFVSMDHFVCCYGDMKDEILRKDSVGTYMARVEYVRNQLDLDEPKRLEFKDYANVLSNAN